VIFVLLTETVGKDLLGTNMTEMKQVDLNTQL